MSGRKATLAAARRSIQRGWDDAADGGRYVTVLMPRTQAKALLAHLPEEPRSTAMTPKWEVVRDPKDLRPGDHLRATGYDDAELKRLPAAELGHLVRLGAVMQRAVRA